MPALQQDSSGPSWTGGSTAGTSVPISKFFIATPSTPILAMDAALALGRNLLLTPGVYDLKAPILVARPNTIVLGLGFPTLVPQHGTAAMQVLGVPGVKLSGMIFDAGPKTSPVLLQLGGPLAGRTAAPAIPRWCRTCSSVSAGPRRARRPTAWWSTAPMSSSTTSGPGAPITVRAWAGPAMSPIRASSSTATNVTAYGLAVEHYQKNEVIWNGQGGEDIFFQNEMPYDPPSQAAWMSGPATDGYPAFLISARVRSFSGYGLGSYCFFNQGVPIESATAFSVPDTPGVQLNDVLTRFLNGSGSIDHVVNGTGAAVTADSPGPSYLASYP